MKQTRLFIIAMALSGCITTRITSTWANKEVSMKKYDPVLVVGIMKDEDSSLCRKMEDSFTEELKKLGYNALAAMSTYGVHGPGDIKEEETFKLLYKQGIGTVITIELAAKEKQTYQQPLWLYSDVYANQYIPFRQRAYSPDRIVVETNYIWVSSLYDMNGFLVLYNVQSKSYSPGAEKSLASEYGKLIINDMLKNRVLQKKVVPLKAF